MAFATRSDLLARSNARRLAQLAIPADVDMVPEAALRTAIAGGDITVYTQAEQDALALALDAIDKALADADALIQSYGIDAAPATTAAALAQLARMSSIIALFFLQGAERMTDTVREGYNDVMGLLKEHARGVVNLAPPAVPDPLLSTDTVQFSSNTRRYADIDPLTGDW